MIVASSDFSRRWAFGAFPVLAAGLADCATAPDVSSDEEARVIDRFFEAYQAMDAAAILALFTDDIHFEDPTFHLRARNREEMRAIVETAAAAFRNVSIEPLNRIQASPWIISQQRQKGTLTLANGSERQVDVQGASIFEIRQGKIARWYDYYDVLTFQLQTGHDV